MSFLFPAFLFGSLAIAIPIVLHLMKRDVAPRVAFSDIRFLRRAPMVQARRRHLRELLLLALRVSALLLLALAFARPFLDATGAARLPVTVVALDRSFSMGAPGTFERARELAVEAIGAAPARHAVAVVEFDHAARIVHPPSDDRAVASTLVRQMVPGFGSTHFASAVSAAVGVIGERAGRVVVVTDLQQSGWDEVAQVVVPARVDVEVVEVGAAVSNAGVTALHVDERGITVVADNTGPELSTTVAAMVDGRALIAEAVVLPTGSSQVRLDVSVPSLGVLDVSLADPTGYPADNRRYAWLDPPEPMALAVVVGSGMPDPSVFYLEQALLAGEASASFSVTSMTAAELARRDLGEFAAMIVLSTEGLDRQGRERTATFVNRGGGLLVSAGPSLDRAIIADILGGDPAIALTDSPSVESAQEAFVRFSVTDARHPVFRRFTDLVGTLAQVRIREALPVIEAERTRVLARFSDGAAALVEYETHAGRVIVFGTDLNHEWNDFPRHPMFVPFVHELMRYLGDGRDARRELGIDELPAGMARAPGPAVWPDSSGRRVVVNVDPIESREGRMTPAAFAARVVAGTDEAPLNAAPGEDVDPATQESEQGYWWFALVGVGLLLIGEAWLGRSVA